ncbi:hypothetical protein ACGFSI_35425 [Streptomyces virginiae]|uniref:hypothetical protein n=1 Tax=Streptomyces virginiae TaxID=1961 RepID=UPI003711F9D9
MAHSCGHTNTHDLSSRSADQRAGYARWLAARQCTNCWRADHQADAASTAEWLAAKRAAEQAAAAAWATQFDMPPLEGPERILDWGERTRHQLVNRAYTALVTEGFPVKSSVLSESASDSVSSSGVTSRGRLQPASVAACPPHLPPRV